ncbi:gluconokinase [Desulfosporosinus fructosivorans]
MNGFTLLEATLGVDIGTTGCRCVAYSDQADVVVKAERLYPTSSPKPGWAEQDSDLVLAQVEECIKDAVKSAAEAHYRVNLISFSAVNHGLIPLFEGKPLRPCIIWADNRSASITEQWRIERRHKEFYEATCCPIHPMYLPGKLVWLAKEEPEIFLRADRFLSLKELLFYRWFGRFVIDASIASSTGLFNVTKFDWDEDIMRITGIRREQLSEIVPTTHVLRGMNREVYDRLGLSADVQVVIGAGDGVLSSLGAGALGPGEVTVMIGTSGAARITVATPTLDSQGRTWCYYLADAAWVVGGAINNAGLTLQWVREKWLNGASFEEVEKLSANVAPGSEGLMLMPFLTGERSPNWDPSIRAALIGLDLAHGPGHFARAAMEGVAYRLKSVFEPIVEMAGVVRSVRIGGGFIASPTWVQIVADVLNSPLEILEEPQGSAFGAVVLGWLAVGRLKTLDECTSLARQQKVVYPNTLQAIFYENQYTHYQRIYDRLYR